MSKSLEDKLTKFIDEHNETDNNKLADMMNKLRKKDSDKVSMSPMTTEESRTRNKQAKKERLGRENIAKLLKSLKFDIGQTSIIFSELLEEFELQDKLFYEAFDTKKYKKAKRVDKKLIKIGNKLFDFKVALTSAGIDGIDKYNLYAHKCRGNPQRKQHLKELKAERCNRK